MSRILIHDAGAHGAECRTPIGAPADEVVRCNDRESLFDALAERRPDLLVYVLDDLDLDLGVLALVRRAAPQLPFILLGGSAGLAARRSVQELRPTYYGVFPLEPSELRDAVRGALSHAGRAAAS